MTTTARRTFLQQLAALGAAGAASPFLSPDAFAEQSWAEQFNNALETHPWLKAYRSIGQTAYEATAEVTGNWPEDLTGTFYRNGPAQHEIAGYRYHHWFDGDGMLQAYHLSSEGVRHQARLIETYKVQAEREAGRALYPGFASIPPEPAGVTSPDSVNVANISVLPHHNKLLALWEAGSPWEMDPETLNTRGIYEFSENTRGVPFSAHPRVEPDGTLWNFGYVSGANLLVLWHIDANGKLVKIGKVDADPISMVHDFVVTSRHIVLMVPPLNYEPSPDRPMTFLDAHVWYSGEATRVLVVDKNDFSNYFWTELPAQWVFHYGNGWEDNNGIIRFDAARADDPFAMIDTFRQVMRGNIVPGSSSHHHQYRIDTSTRSIAEVPMFSPDVDSEFPCVDPRVSCRQNRKLTMLSSSPSTSAIHGSLNEVSTFDFDTGERKLYRYPDHQMPEEHLYVPRPGSVPEQDGWIVGTALNWRDEQMLLNVFDVSHVDDGPVATATLPYALPFGLHGKFAAG